VRDILDAGPGRAPGADDDEPFALEGPLGGLVAALRAPADLGPGVDAAVMAAVRLAPPLTVTRTEIRHALDALRAAVGDLAVPVQHQQAVA